MLLERPKSNIERVQLTAIDPAGESPSKTITVYETTPEALIELVKEAVASKAKSSSKKSAVSAK